MSQPPSQPQRTVLVTGATGAIGSQIVRDIVRDRCQSSTRFAAGRVVAGYNRSDRLAHDLQAESGCDLRQADIGEEARVEALFNGLDDLFAVVHCAGIARDALLVKQSRASWDETMRVNATGTFLVVRQSLRYLGFGGRLIVLASRAGERGAVGQSAYAASKAATIALVQSAAREGAQRRICVNAICPGVVSSTMTQTLNTKRQDELASQSVFGTFGSAQAVSSVVQWLLGEVGGEVSGQVIHCDSRLPFPFLPEQTQVFDEPSN